MRKESIEEVWATLDREPLVRVAGSGPEPVFATISGAHLYGFASPDSDVDLRGAFLLPARDLLGLRPASETFTLSDRGPVELDWVAHDLRKFARLMTSHNGYVLEQLFSPLVVLSGPLHEELRHLGRGCATRPTVRHYQGFARGQRRRLREPRPTVKHLLYAFRVLWTGIHLMRTGEVLSNLPALNEEFGLAWVEELIERKRAGSEAMELGAADLAAAERHLDRLQATLDEAHAASSLPNEPTTLAALDDLVVRARLEAVRKERS